MTAIAKIPAAVASMPTPTPSPTPSPVKTRISPKKRTPEQFASEVLAANQAAVAHATTQAVTAAQQQNENKKLSLQLKNVNTELQQSQAKSAATQAAMQTLQRTTAEATVRVTHAQEGQQTAETRLQTSQSGEIAKEVELQELRQEVLARHFSDGMKIIQEFQRSFLEKMKDAAFEAGIIGTYSGIFGGAFAAVVTKDLRGARDGCVLGFFSGMTAKTVAMVFGSEFNTKAKHLTIATSIYHAYVFCKKKKLAWNPKEGVPEAGKDVFAIVCSHALWAGNSEEAIWMRDALEGKEPKRKPMFVSEMDRGLEETDGGKETLSNQTAVAKQIVAKSTTSAAQPSTAAAASASSSWVMAPVTWIKSFLSSQ